MGLPMWDRTPKAASDAAAGKSTISNASLPPVLEANASSSSRAVDGAATLGTDDRFLRWERLHAIRNRLVDRMHRLEMDELLNSTNRHRAVEQTNEANASDSQTSDAALSHRSATSSSSQRLGSSVEIMSNWASLHGEPERSSHQLGLGNEGSSHEVYTRSESGGTGGRRGEVRPVGSSRRRGIDLSGDALLSSDEFLRESRDQNPNREVASTLSQSSSVNPHRTPSYPNPLDPIPVFIIRGSRRDAGDVSPTLNLEDGSGSASAQEITVPQTLPAATWLSLATPSSSQLLSSPNQETFDTFINHIRRIGHLQDAMLATIRSTSNSENTQTSSTRGEGPSPITSRPGAPPRRSTEATSSTAFSTPQVSATAQTITASTTSPVDAEPGPALTAAEARLRAMQTRIDILVSEFSLLRSTWALSHAETQNYERSLRRLQEYLPNARRAERIRRGERERSAALDYDIWYGETAREREELLPRNSWDAELDSEPRMQSSLLRRVSRRRNNVGSVGDQRRGGGSAGTISTSSSGDSASGEQQQQQGERSTEQVFSPSIRELHKELLAAKMYDLAVKGMR